MYNLDISSLTWDLGMYGWQLWPIMVTFHLRWNCLEFAAIWDRVPSGLPASLLPMSSSVERNSVA
jgi:hypothetical protein